MKRLAVLGLVLFGALQAYPEVAYDFSIRVSEERLMKRFEIDSPQLGSKTIWKRAIEAPTHYDLYDKDGNWEGEAIACFFCMSLLYEWGIEIEIFNKEDLRIGFIEGHSDGRAAARIDLYNGRDQRVGIAFLGKGCDEIVVRSPDNGAPLATLERIEDSWNVDVIDRRRMDPRLLQILATWAIDRQDAFLRYE